MFCDRVKEYLSQKGVEYVVRDVTQDETAVDDLQELGAMTTPVVVIDGKVVVGFDSERLDELLS